MNARITQGRDIRRMALFASLATLVAGGAASVVDAKPKKADPGMTDPTTTEVLGVFRDFRKHNQPGGHADFGKNPNAGDAHSMGNVADTLDTDGCPVFTGAGRVVSSQWTDSGGRPIHPSLYDVSEGDVMGIYGTVDDGAIQSQISFRQWFRDVPGVNTSAAFALEFVLDETINAWVYDEDKHVKTNQAIIGGGSNSNFEYSYALDLEVRYHAGDGDYIEVSGMDDMWVFIDGKLVADLGGVNHAATMFVPLDRLGLTDGEKYEVKIFMTERIKQRQGLRIVLAADFFGGSLPTTMGMYD